MAEIELCKECSVSLIVAEGHTWHDNGVVTTADDPDYRMTFFESNDIKMVFARLEEMIGLSIDRVIIESKSREARQYAYKSFPPLTDEVKRHLDVDAVASYLADHARAFGFGDVRPLKWRREGDDDDYLTMSVKNPHSLLLLCGELVGIWEIIDGREQYSTFERVGEDEYHITNRVGLHPVELRERLQFHKYPFKPGDIVFERCWSCNVPLGVAGYQWNAAAGTITKPETGRRMALVGPSGIEAILNDLEAELGETIPAAVVEAQRLHVKNAMKKDNWKGPPTDYRQDLAFRGLGNLTHFGGRREHLEITIENACMPLMTVGFTQGFYELALGYEESSYEYEFTDDGVLSVGITAVR
jgi:hypothetical protein